MSTSPLAQFDTATRANIQAWQGSDYDEATRAAIQELLETSPERLVDGFYTNLSFGTGGMRGLMGIGTNRINNYTIRAATQGLANYLTKQEPPDGKIHKVIVGHDSRLGARAFAEEIALVLAGNNIQVYLSPSLRPTPWVSFGCRHLHCTAGIMLTASHNPPAYQGYKVYWSDGAQLLPPHDEGMMAEVVQVATPKAVKRATSLSHPLIVLTDTSLEEAYLKTIAELQLYPEQNRREGASLKIAYTPLHGTGIVLAPQGLASWGFTNLHLVASQAVPDGHFPTVVTANPEEPQALEQGIARMKEVEADLLLATDPDADRVGVVVRHHDAPYILNGQQVACLCLNHVLSAYEKQQAMPSRAACIKSLPTTELFAAIADRYGVACFDVLTGFKYIAALIRQWEADPSDGYRYLFGGEESYGYLLGTYARDKDAISACALIAEAALEAKLRGMTLVDELHLLYRTYGIYTERLLSLSFSETKEGKEEMDAKMTNLRNTPPTAIGDYPVISIEDYKSLMARDSATGVTTPLDFPSSDVLLFRLPNRGKLIIRPSGTEPRIKLYGALMLPCQEDIPAGIVKGQQAADTLLSAARQQLLSS